MDKNKHIGSSLDDLLLDEYGIKGVLISCGLNDANLLKLLNDHLDSTLAVYLDRREGVRKAAFTEMKVFLQSALLDTRDNNGLRARVTKIAEEL